MRSAHPKETVKSAIQLVSDGATLGEASRRLGVARSTIARWTNPEMAARDQARRRSIERRTYLREYQRRRMATDPAFKEYRLQKQRSPCYRAKYKVFQRRYKRERYASNVQFRLACILRARLYDALKKGYKNGSAVRNAGCSLSHLKSHIGSMFKDGMPWDNFGKWHVDHKLPLSSFDLSNKQQFLQAVHWTNLQPMWATDNIVKGKKIIKE